MNKEDLKKNNTENSISMANSAFSDQIPAVYGGGSGAGGGFFDNSHGYLDLDMLAFQDDEGGTSLFDLLQQPPAPASATMPETAEVVNTPTTNSSSISSSSNEAAIDGDQENNTTKSDDDDQDKTTNKQLKGKKKNPKKQREPRFAFMTRTEVDNLDDGYRWRKYGQKAVKNSPFPRSYYRCTSASCGVKKRVERSSEDPSIVVTTYEGTHGHPIPVTSRGIVMPETANYGALNGGVSSFLLPPQPVFHNQLTSLSFKNTINPSSYSHYLQERQFCPPSLLKDDGLLQDMVPFQVRKEEQD